MGDADDAGGGPADAPRPTPARATSSTARSGGTWEEPEHTGTGFPGDFYINYHLYRHVFPLMALAPYASTDA